MRILLYRADGNSAPWIRDFADFMPEAEVVVWREGVGEIPACDYAVLWTPPPSMLADLARVKAIFLTGAGAASCPAPVSRRPYAASRAPYIISIHHNLIFAISSDAWYSPSRAVRTDSAARTIRIFHI